MQLFGHDGAIHSAKFSSSGATLASGSFDRLICEEGGREGKIGEGCIPSLFFLLKYSAVMHN